MGQTSSRPRKLPRWLWTFFWDVDPKALDPVGHRDFILGRLLARGDRRAWKWVRRHWTEEELREFLLPGGPAGHHAVSDGEWLLSSMPEAGAVAPSPAGVVGDGGGGGQPRAEGEGVGGGPEASAGASLGRWRSRSGWPGVWR